MIFSLFPIYTGRIFQFPGVWSVFTLPLLTDLDFSSWALLGVYSYCGPGIHSMHLGRFWESVSTWEADSTEVLKGLSVRLISYCAEEWWLLQAREAWDLEIQLCLLSTCSHNTSVFLLLPNQGSNLSKGTCCSWALNLCNNSITCRTILRIWSRTLSDLWL
jgi:hypothetical protein